MNNRSLGLIGAALVAVGLFTPIVTVPILGNVNLFSNGTNLIGIDLLVLAAIAAVLATKNRLRDLIWPGIAASGILLYEFGSLQYRLAQMRESLNKDLQGNPFAGLAQGAANAIQIQWGWLILAAGAGLLLHVGLSSPKEQDEPAINLRENASRVVAAVSLVLLLFAPVWDRLSRSSNSSTYATNTALKNVDANATDVATPSTGAQGPSAEEAAYIKQNLRLYDLTARYYDSELDGRVPGVEFKIQNNGNRTLNGVTVRVVFDDTKGNPIAEEEYNPVIVSQYNFGGDNTPLRPHYIWQQEHDKFYEAKNVPSEWAEGRATAIIANIEFAPNG
jgi:hypothetical protein